MTLDDLIAFGANVDEGMQRCMNNEAFYLGLVESVKSEANFDALQAAIDAGDLDAAFEAAHALKGVLANLAITPLYEPANQICELLRAKEEADYPTLVAALMGKLEEFKAL